MNYDKYEATFMFLSYIFSFHSKITDLTCLARTVLGNLNHNSNEELEKLIKISITQ